MKVVLINTSDSAGGAAIACHRLFEAHQSTDLATTLLVWEKIKTTNKSILEPELEWRYKAIKNLNFYLEKLAFLPYEASKSVRFAFSTAKFGIDISKNKAVQEADIIHLHWINKGFLSLDSLQQLVNLKKPIVWTLHDMWAFTGGCHYSDDCINYQTACGNCMFLKNKSTADLSNNVWAKKQELFKYANFHFVTCSNWLQDIALKSSLLNNLSVHSIPNPINTEQYKSIKRATSAKYSILFQAMNIVDIRKGFIYFIEALNYLKITYPDFSKKIKLVFFGKSKNLALDNLGFESEDLGFLSNSEDIINTYQRTHLFVIPSLQDNLPNTVMEALSCGLPVVGFDTGGIPEMVTHKVNGYIAKQKDAKDLGEGIKWTLEEKDRYTNLSINARLKVEEQYSYKVISQKYHQLYQKVLKNGYSR